MAQDGLSSRVWVASLDRTMACSVKLWLGRSSEEQTSFHTEKQASKCQSEKSHHRLFRCTATLVFDTSLQLDVTRNRTRAIPKGFQKFTSWTRLRLLALCFLVKENIPEFHDFTWIAWKGRDRLCQCQTKNVNVVATENCRAAWHQGSNLTKQNPKA